MGDEYIGTIATEEVCGDRIDLYDRHGKYIGSKTKRHDGYDIFTADGKSFREVSYDGGKTSYINTGESSIKTTTYSDGKMDISGPDGLHGVTKESYNGRTFISGNSADFKELAGAFYGSDDKRDFENTYSNSYNTSRDIDYGRLAEYYATKNERKTKGIFKTDDNDSLLAEVIFNIFFVIFVIINIISIITYTYQAIKTGNFLENILLAIAFFVLTYIALGFIYLAITAFIGILRAIAYIAFLPISILISTFCKL